MNRPKDFYSPEEVAETLGLHVRTVRRFIREGKVRATRIGKQYRIPSAELERLAGQANAAPVPRSRRVAVSSIVDVAAISRPEADRLTTAVTGAFTATRDSTLKGIHTVYYEEEGRLRITIHASASYTAAILGMIEAVLEDGRPG
jgi:excisionase family DNA binding protein